MDGIDYWKFCDAFTPIQATLLCLGTDPTLLQYEVLHLEPHEMPKGFDAIFSALKNAINRGKLKADIKYFQKQVDIGDFDFTFVDTDEINYEVTLVEVNDLKQWLSERNFKPAFFFEVTKTDAPDYLNPKHSHYSPKLAAAIRAWEAVSTDSRYSNNGKAPKTNIEAWLTAHAGDLGLVKEDGEINADAIKNQIAKVVNWKTEGGAPKTPSR
jgi:hypothetical protein